MTKSRVVSWSLGVSRSLERVLKFILCSNADLTKRYRSLFSPTPIVKMKYSIAQLYIFLNILQNYPNIYNYSIPEHKDKIKLRATFDELRAEVTEAGEKLFQI